MARQARYLRDVGTRGVRWLRYRPGPGAAWPKGTDAADVLAGLEPAVARELVLLFADSWAEPVPEPPPPPAPVYSPAKLEGSGSVSAALFERYGLHATPGRSVRCPAHEDRRASLSVLRDDLRAVCHAGSCPWSGRGVIARDVLEGVRA
jgi:hypothetical protein